MGGGGAAAVARGRRRTGSAFRRLGGRMRTGGMGRAVRTTPVPGVGRRTTRREGGSVTNVPLTGKPVREGRVLQLGGDLSIRVQAASVERGSARAGFPQSGTHPSRTTAELLNRTVVYCPRYRIRAGPVGAWACLPAPFVARPSALLLLLYPANVPALYSISSAPDPYHAHT